MLIIKDKELNCKKLRLDVFLTIKGIAKTRSKAQQYIREGHVKVDGKICTKSGTLVIGDTLIELDKNAIPYVSRGGVKLDYALKSFKINVTNRTCLDIGASTGGFTDCLLKHGARFVYAIDVGHEQLNSELRNNPRVLSIEGIDIRNFSLPEKEQVDLICIDVSFISLTLILPIVKLFLSTNGEIIILIKPQFEVGPGIVNKKGVVKNKKYIYEVLKKVLMCARKLELFPVSIIRSPIQGKKGNVEYLAHLKVETNEKSINLDNLISELTYKGDEKMKKLVIEWKSRRVNDDGSQSKKIVGMAHPGCCRQSGGGCPKKHGG